MNGFSCDFQLALVLLQDGLHRRARLGALPIDFLAGRVILEAVPSCYAHGLLQLVPVVDVLLYFEVTILYVEGVFGVYVYWYVVFQLGFLSLSSTVKVQELFPYILVKRVA